MATEILQKTGTPIVWADATDWPVGGAHGFGNDDYQLDLTALADTKAWQGVKGNLGATRAAAYQVWAGLEWGASAPTAGESVYFYWSESQSDTAGTGNTGGASGADGAYHDSSEEEWLKQLNLPWTFTATNDGQGTTQIMRVGTLYLPARYGMPVVWNESGQALDSDAANMFFAIVPIIDESQ